MAPSSPGWRPAESTRSNCFMTRRSVMRETRWRGITIARLHQSYTSLLRNMRNMTSKFYDSSHPIFATFSQIITCRLLNHREGLRDLGALSLDVHPWDWTQLSLLCSWVKKRHRKCSQILFLTLLSCLRKCCWHHIVWRTLEKWRVCQWCVLSNSIPLCHYRPKFWKWILELLQYVCHSLATIILVWGPFSFPETNNFCYVVQLVTS